MCRILRRLHLQLQVGQTPGFRSFGRILLSYILYYIDSPEDVVDICSDNDACDGEKPKAKEDSSPTDAILGTSATRYLLRKKCTPTKTALPGAMMTLPPPRPIDDAVSYDIKDGVYTGVDGDDVGDHVDVDNNENTDPVTDTARVTPSRGRWTREEDAELTSAITNTKKKWWGREYKPDWMAVAALVPGRTKTQCQLR
jgi:hypothetical protein